MSTHEITAADCTWADLHFLDVGEARDYLTDLIAARQSLQSLRAARVTAAEFSPTATRQDELARIDRAISGCENEEKQLHQLIADCIESDLFDAV